MAASKKRKPAERKASIEFTGKHRPLRCWAKTWKLIEQYERLTPRQQIEFLVLVTHSAGVGGKSVRLMRMKAKDELPWDIAKELGQRLRRYNRGKPERLHQIISMRSKKPPDSWGQIDDTLGLKPGTAEQQYRRWNKNRK